MALICRPILDVHQVTVDSQRARREAEGEEAENEKWAAISAVKNELVNRAKENGYSYREPVTFEKLNEMIDYRLMNNEILMNAYPDDAAQLEACQKENAAIEAFRATLPKNGSGEEAYAYWQQYWQDAIHQDAPSYFVPAMTLTIYNLRTSPSGEKTYTLSAEDAAAVEALFSINSMTPAASDSESVCAYQFAVIFWTIPLTTWMWSCAKARVTIHITAST